MDRRLTELSPEALAFVETASVLGTLGALACVDEPLAVLDEAVEAGVLTWDADEDPVFADPALRAALRREHAD
jgi:hypothetical protein